MPASAAGRCARRGLRGSENELGFGKVGREASRRIAGPRAEGDCGTRSSGLKASYGPAWGPRPQAREIAPPDPNVVVGIKGRFLCRPGVAGEQIRGGRVVGPRQAALPYLSVPNGIVRFCVPEFGGMGESSTERGGFSQEIGAIPSFFSTSVWVRSLIRNTWRRMVRRPQPMVFWEAWRIWCTLPIHGTYCSCKGVGRVV